MKKILSNIRPEEAIAIISLLLFGIFNLSGQWHYRRPYAVIIAAYSESYFFPAATLLLLSVVVWRRNNLRLHPFRDWLPFVICLMSYEALHDFVHWINPHDQDALLASIDYRIFGAHPTVWLERFINPQLTDYLSFTYILYFFFPPLLGFVLYFRRKIGPFRDSMLAVVIACFLGYIGYLLVPAVGPKYFQSALYTRELAGGTIGSSIIYTVDTLKPIPRDCFPSLHTALTTIVLFFAYRHSRILFYVVLPLAVSLYFSTLYLRYHYFIDIVAGWALAFLAAWSSVRLNSWWYRNINDVIGPAAHETR